MICEMNGISGKKICLVSAVPGTLWAFYSGLIKRLKELSVDVTIVSSDSPLLHDFEKKLGCRVFPLEITRRMSPLRDLLAVLRLARHYRRQRYDIVHGHTAKGGMVGMIAAFIAGLPVRIFSLHGLLIETSTGLKRKLLWFIETLTCRTATTVLVDSPSIRVKALQERLCSPEKMKSLGNGTACGINLELFNPEKLTLALRSSTRANLGIPDDAIVAGFVGRIVPDKGIECLVDAFELAGNKADNVYMVLVGLVETVRERISQNIKHRIERNPRIICTGRVPDVVPLYAAMDFVVLPSRREGFPYVPLEAAAMGLPTIVSRATGCVDAVVDNVTGLIVDVDNSEQLCDAMLRLAGDAALRKELGQKGYERVCKFFDEKSMIDEHIRLYENAIGRRGNNQQLS
jgi:glycosyltransferase involved in cell wall biosynthesis